MCIILKFFISLYHQNKREKYHYYAIWFKTIRIKNNIAKMYNKEELIKAAYIKSTK